MILVREVNVKNDSNKVDNLKTFILNPFNLGDKQISKTEATADKSNVVATLYNPELKQTLNNARPEVFIYHSHTSEGYLASGTVTTVGDVIDEELEKNYGIAVIHDKTVNDKGD